MKNVSGKYCQNYMPRCSLLNLEIYCIDEYESMRILWDAQTLPCPRRRDTVNAISDKQHFSELWNSFTFEYIINARWPLAISYYATWWSHFTCFFFSIFVWLSVRANRNYWNYYFQKHLNSIASHSIFIIETCSHSLYVWLRLLLHEIVKNYFHGTKRRDTSNDRRLTDVNWRWFAKKQKQLSNKLSD